MPNIIIYLQNPKVTSWTINPAQLERLRVTFPRCDIQNAENETDFLNYIRHADAVITWNFKKAWYDANPRLNAVFTPAAGHDWVSADPSGKTKTYYGAWHGKIMRESLISMMLYFNRRIHLSLAEQKAHRWDKTPYDTVNILGSQTVLIIGYGHIAVQCAELLKAFGCEVIGVKRDPLKRPMPSPADRIAGMEHLPTLLPQADHVVFLLPGGTETDRIFKSSYFGLMKPSACVFNLGRGNCYDENDLVQALKSGAVYGAGLDVFDPEPLNASSPLWDLPNILITPHSSAIARQYLDFYLDEAIPQLQKELS